MRQQLQPFQLLLLAAVDAADEEAHLPHRQGRQHQQFWGPLNSSSSPRPTFPFWRVLMVPGPGQPSRAVQACLAELAHVQSASMVRLPSAAWPRHFALLLPVTWGWTRRPRMMPPWPAPFMTSFETWCLWMG